MSFTGEKGMKGGGAGWAEVEDDVLTAATWKFGAQAKVAEAEWTEQDSGRHGKLQTVASAFWRRTVSTTTNAHLWRASCGAVPTVGQDCGRTRRRFVPPLRWGAVAAANRRRQPFAFSSPAASEQHDSGVSLWAPNVDVVTLICHFVRCN